MESAQTESRELAVQIPPRKQNSMNKGLPPLTPRVEAETEEEDKVEEDKVDEARIDFEARNMAKLKAVQEARGKEAKMIEDERQKVVRRQEKLKNMILKQAADYKEEKQRREKERQE